MNEVAIKPTVDKKALKGDRVSGKPWKVEKQSYNTSLNHKGQKTNFSSRRAKQEQERLLKKKLAGLKEEKEKEKSDKIENLKKKREEKEEKERYERLAEKYHKKKVERIRRKEKRNKLLADGKK